MKEAENNLFLRGSYSLPRSVILKKKDSFQRLFQKGVFFKQPTLGLRMYTFDDHPFSYKVAFIASKRQGNAVKRNKIKRRLRELFRLHQSEFLPFAERPLSFHCALIAFRPDATLAELEIDYKSLFSMAQQRFLTFSHV